MEQNMKYKKNEKGITLVALVVTIIILLILAGITVASLTGNNGLIGKSGEAKNATEIANEKEELEVAITRSYDKRGNLNATKVVDGINKDVKNLNSVTAIDGKFPVMIEYKNGHKYGISKDGDIIENIIAAGETAPDESNAIYISGNNIAIIPAGYTVSNVKVVNEITGVVEKDETTIENGLVVKDKNQNEWVWIPVSGTDFLAMFGTASDEGWTMLGTSVKTKYKTLGTTLASRTLNRTDPGKTGDQYYREPDVLSVYDTDEDYRKQAGFVEADGTIASSLETMATKLKDDYENMMRSIKENRGFYIGRYELGKNTDDNNKLQVKAGTVMNHVTWHKLYFACKSFSNENVESRMIWGCQWDQICRFINEHGDKVDLDDSTTYGNYNNSQSPANVTGTGNLQKTGFSEYWKTNNIYDLAGNCIEWTQEAYKTNQRAWRGRSLYT